VLLPTPAVADSSSSDVETQVQIALSATVLERAGQAVEPALSGRSVKKMVTVTAPTNQLIQIEATSPRATEAQRVSQAVADSYVGYVSNTAREVSDAALADLNVRRDDLQAQIKQLQVEIAKTLKRQKAVDPDSAEGKKEAQLLAGLRTHQADLSVQLNKVQDMIATGGPVGSVTGAGTAVVQPATEARGLSPLMRLLIWAPLTAVVFTILTAVVLLAAARRDPRLRLRDDIADAVGSPVLAALRSMPQQSVSGWSTLLETYEATPIEEWAFRRILRGSLPTDRKAESRIPGRVDHPTSLTVISLSGDGRGLAIGPQLAAFASSLGMRTRLMTAGGHEWVAAALWAACAAEYEAPLRPGLYIGDVPPGEAIDMTITLVLADRAHPNLAEVPAGAATILSVAAATATQQELARVAVAVDDVGRRIDGIVVADPDQADQTSGRHTMDERSLRPVLPTRLTGVVSSDSAAGALKRSRS
jgi:phosphoribosylformylglycinamidine (FGAM) synthase PurS component